VLGGGGCQLHGGPQPRWGGTRGGDEAMRREPGATSREPWRPSPAGPRPPAQQLQELKASERGWGRAEMGGFTTKTVLAVLFRAVLREESEIQRV